jgi:DHA2 family multidrug resistance protein
VILLRRIDFRFVMMLGFSSFAAASLWATQLTGAWRMDDFIPVALLQSGGLGMTFTAVMVGNFTSIKPEVAASFSAYIQILRLLAVEFGAALMITLLRVREQIHSNLLGLHVARGDGDVLQSIAERMSRFMADDTASAKGHALSSMAATVQREANVLAYIDGFALTFVFAVLGILLAGAMRRAPPGPLTGR